ncbi:MAG TPA: MFS transporter [Candidatus Binatia bacterium]|nr:MFS transporter [Candidatus Binatia bacterium]
MADSANIEPKSAIRLGLRENLPQFSLLVLINAFVGAMVGLERTLLPLIAEKDFGLGSKTAILSFIATFGIVKAFSNLLAGRLSDQLGRKNILVIGWLIGVPVPFMVMWAPTWNWIVLANVFLGINQGLCWSTTVIMKIDLVGPSRRGLAMGLNEFAGYLAVALTAFATGYIASISGLRPQPFYLGIAFVLLGLMLSAFFAKETREYALQEGQLVGRQDSEFGNRTASPSFAKILLVTSWKDPALFSCSQAGMINNLNDGVAWGLFPLLFASGGLTVGKIGFLAAVYPATWGLLQLWSGTLSDRLGRKSMIVIGMWVQALGIWLIAFADTFAPWLLGSFLLGLGTALVYPTLLAAVSDVAHPDWRASAVGVYRLWRDGGYALGAMLSGIIADLLGLEFAIAVIGGITFLSGVVTAIFMYETLPRDKKDALSC